MAPGRGPTSPACVSSQSFDISNNHDLHHSSSSALSQDIQQSYAHPQSAHSQDSSDDDGDSAPLFDPSGLSSSFSRSKRSSHRDGGSVDLNSHAAFRLGISPRQQQESNFASFNLPTSSSRQPIAKEADSPARVRQVQEETWSSSHTPSSASSSSIAAESPSPANEWWKRNRKPDETSRPSLHVDPEAARRPTIAHHLSSQTFQGNHPSRMASDPGSISSPGLGRSPAANFLSSFSANTTTPSTSVADDQQSQALMETSAQTYLKSISEARTKSLSPSRPGSQVYTSSPLDASSSSFQGLSGAAANLYGREREPSNTDSVESSPGPEGEGFQFGPDARFTLGKPLGFGGFSTIREGFDSKYSRDGEPHKVAIKLTFRNLEDSQTSTEELAVWKSLPSHVHLLPLMYDERIVVDRPVTSNNAKDTTTKQELEYLVMPLCDAGNLMEFIRAEGRRNAINSGAAGRSLSRNQPFQQALDNASKATPSTTNGSAMLSRSGPRNPSVSSTLAMQRVPSLSSAGSGSIMRSSSLRGPRSQGVPLTLARSITHQMAEALTCLHSSAQVVHGDIKLENILGQSTISKSSSPEYEDSTSPPGRQLDSSRLCWRLADFGLSRRIDETQQEEKVSRCSALTSAMANSQEADATEKSATGEMQRSTSKESAKKAKNFGGSIAYSAPEVWREETALPDVQPISPYAADIWALGCVVYALLSGRLPFNDAFEPRLQTKIAQAEWDVPPRLWRRARRLASAAAPLGSGRQHERSSSVKSGSESSASSHRESFSGPMSASLTAGGGWAARAFSPIAGEDRIAKEFGRRTSIEASDGDLSASVPNLPPPSSPQRQLHRGGMQNITSSTDSQIVGSVPCDPAAPGRFEIDQEAQAAADLEADAESDDDTIIDQALEGTSTERAAAREVLRGLLEPDPSKRWTVERLLESRWMQQSSDFGGHVSFECAGGDIAVSLQRATSRPDAQLTSVNEEVEEGYVPRGRALTRPKEMPGLSFEKIQLGSADAADGKQQQSPQRAGMSARRPSSLSRSRPRPAAGGSASASGSGVSTPQWSGNGVVGSDGTRRRQGFSEDGETCQEHEVGVPGRLRPLSTSSSHASLNTCGADEESIPSTAASMIIHDDERGDAASGRSSSHSSPHLDKRGRGQRRSRMMMEVKEDELLSQFSHDGDHHHHHQEYDAAVESVGADLEPRRGRSRPRPIPLPHSASSSSHNSRSSSRVGMGIETNRSKSTSRMATKSRLGPHYQSYDVDDFDTDEERRTHRRGSNLSSQSSSQSRSKRSSSTASHRSTSSSHLTGGGGGGGASYKAPPSLLSSSATTVGSSSIPQYSSHFEYGRQQPYDEEQSEEGSRGRGWDRRSARVGAGGFSMASKSSSSRTSGGSGSASRSRSRAPDALNQILRTRTRESVNEQERQE